MQAITITGFLSRDAEQRSTQSGDQVTTWSVPVRQGWGDKERTNWFKVSIWGKRADFAAKARKGEFVTVTGELTIGEWEGKPQYEVRANDFQNVTTAKRDESAKPAREPDGSRGHADNAGSFADELDRDIPFVRNDTVW